ncbi:MAG: hypothetical protein ACYCVD_19805 [Desulfitobacteriaceae bacterium]
MWKRWLREFSVQFYWLKRDFVQHWRLDTPIGTMGILVILAGMGLLVTLGQGLAKIFRSFVPWVSGGNMATVYWQSIGFGFKASFLLLIFFAALIAFLVLKLFENR